ncbi:MAG: Uma2 family endonuclease [Verrucomicrobiales bacterium]
MENAAKTAPALLRGGQPWPLSVAAYRTLGEAGLLPKNTELLHGFVYTKMSKSPLHSFLVLRLLRLMADAVAEGLLVRSEQPLSFPDSEPEPDISIVQGTELDYVEDHPHSADLVVEVSVTSHEFDRSKLRAYATAGVKECWLVLAPEQRIEIYRKPEAGAYLERIVHEAGDIVTSPVLSGLRLSVSELFARR